MFGDTDDSRSENNQKKLEKEPWTKEEDNLLKAYVEQHGEGNWKAVSENSGLSRGGKSCRFRWVTYLRPGLKQGPFTEEEAKRITQLHALYGNKWAKIASHFSGRTDNEIKNYWNAKFKRSQRKGLPVYPDGVQVMNAAAPQSSGYLRADQIPIPFNDPSSYLRHNYSIVDGFMKERQSPLRTSESPYPLSHRVPETSFPLTTMNEQSSLPWDYAITPEQMLENEEQIPLPLELDYAITSEDSHMLVDNDDQIHLPLHYPFVESIPVEQFTQQLPMLDNHEQTTPPCGYSLVEITPEQIRDYLETTASSPSQPLTENLELPSFQSHEVTDSLGAQQSDPVQQVLETPILDNDEQIALPLDSAFTSEQFTDCHMLDYGEQIPPHFVRRSPDSPFSDSPFIERTPEQIRDYLKTALSSASQPLSDVAEKLKLPSFQSHDVTDSLGALQSDPMQVPESDNTLLQFPASDCTSSPLHDDWLESMLAANANITGEFDSLNQFMW